MSVRCVCACSRGIVDHTNVGAIFRSAAALNVYGNFGQPYVLRPAVSSLGPREHGHGVSGAVDAHWQRGSCGRMMARAALHEAGFSCAAMALTDDSVSLDDPVLQEIDRPAIFMGTEGAGLGAKTYRGLRPGRAHSDGARGRFA